MRNLIIAFGGILIGISAWAGEAARPGSSAASSNGSICKFGDQGVLKTAKASSPPNYFFRTFNHGGKEYVSYASSSHLNLLDLKSGKEYKFRGMYDPVPVGEGVMSTPMEEGMEFFSVRDILAGDQTPDGMTVAGETEDKRLGGVYQSVGLLKSSGGKKVYRVISDAGNATAADYEVQEGAPPKMRLVRQPTRICRNVDFKLPMLSKDGTMMSGYDAATGTTKIWKINIETGECQELENLGMGVGKADFSYGDDKLTFHTINGQSVDEYFATTEEAMNMNVYVYDRKKKTLTKMTQNKSDENAYYPVFRPDGTIVYSHIDGNGEPTFVHANPLRGRAVPFDTKKLGEKERAALFSIGQLWNKECLGGIQSTSYATSVSTALSLDAKTCNKLVNDFWNANRAKVLEAAQLNPQTKNVNELTAAQLKAACPKDTTEAAPVTAIAASSSAPVGNPGQQALAKKCSICHAQFNLRELATKGLPAGWKQKILTRIHSSGADKMPKVGSLTNAEIKQIEDYLARAR